MYNVYMCVHTSRSPKISISLNPAITSQSSLHMTCQWYLTQVTTLFLEILCSLGSQDPIFSKFSLLYHWSFFLLLFCVSSFQNSALGLSLDPTLLGIFSSSMALNTIYLLRTPKCTSPRVILIWTPGSYISTPLHLESNRHLKGVQIELWILANHFLPLKKKSLANF